MRRRINKVRTASRERLDEETDSIRKYYQQLIKETENQSRRWATKVEEREDRIRWLQLEWKRRIEEANQFWEPHVNAYLVALGLQMVPRVAYRYAVPKAKGRKATRTGPVRVWDEASKTLLLPYCSDCGKTDLTDPEIGSPGVFICHECVDARARKIEEKKKGNGRRKRAVKPVLKVLDRPGRSG
jgi:hypothetical protein